VCLADLDAQRLRAVFAQIASTTNSKGRPQSAATMHHLRATLRAALNVAVHDGLIDTNPARHLEITGYAGPYARVWTEDRVEDWRRTGHRPAVAVWTAEHLAVFSTPSADDSLFALWWLIALRGLRRGEACGLRFSDADLDLGLLSICRSRTTAGYHVVEGPTKTLADTRTVALDRHTVHALREHRRRQTAQRTRRLAAGTDCEPALIVRMLPSRGCVRRSSPSPVARTSGCWPSAETATAATRRSCGTPPARDDPGRRAAPTTHRVRPRRAQAAVFLAFSPDGQLLAVAADQRTRVVSQYSTGPEHDDGMVSRWTLTSPRRPRLFATLAQRGGARTVSGRTRRGLAATTFAGYLVTARAVAFSRPDCVDR
jgi:hypothetical protein